MPTRNLSKSDSEALASFRCRLRRFLGFTKAVSRRNSVTPLQYRLLLQIKGSPGREWSTVPELAERLQIKHHSVVALLSRCDAAGLVNRSAIRSDDQCVELRLSPAGQLCLERGARLETSRKAMGCFFVPGLDDDARGGWPSMSSTP